MFLYGALFSNEPFNGADGMKCGGMVAIETSANRLERFAGKTAGQVHCNLSQMGNVPLTGPRQEFLHANFVMFANQFLNAGCSDFPRPSCNILGNAFSQFNIYGQLKKRSLSRNANQPTFELSYVLGKLAGKILDYVLESRNRVTLYSI